MSANNGGKPKENGANGRDAMGRWAKGNPGGPGNPDARAASEWRSIIRNYTDTEQLREAWVRLVQLAATGEGADWRFAVKEVFERTFGKVKETVAVEDNGGMFVALRASLEALMKRPDIVRALEDEA